MSSDVEHSRTKAKFSCSSCWKVFLDKDICMEHMLGHVTETDSDRNARTETSRDSDGACHVSDSDRNARTETSRDSDGACPGSGIHNTDDKNNTYDCCIPASAENRSLSGEFHGNCKTQCCIVLNEASTAETSVGNTRNRTNGIKCKKNMSKRTTCKYCHLDCGDSANLFKHEKIHKKIYVCEICKKQFTIHYRYLVHSKIHNDDRAYQCEVCKKRFIEKTCLTTHMRYHTKSDLLYCDICRREFIKESALTKHMEVHSDDRPYKCKYCESSFKREQHLIRHQSKHSVSRPRPFRCDKCGIAYLDRLGLSRHIKSYHNEKRDVIQTNFKTRNVKSLIVDCGSVESKLESTMLEPVESESENRATASTLLELAGGSSQPALPPQPEKASVPASSGSVNIISLSGLPPSSSSSVEPMISMVGGSKFYKITTLAEDNALSNISEAPLALTLETQCSTIVTADSSEVPLVFPTAARNSTALTGSSEVPLVLPPATRNSTALTGSSEVNLVLPPATRNSTALTGSSEIPLALTRAAQCSVVITGESSVVPSPLPLAPQRSTDSSEVTLALPLDVHSSFVMPIESTEYFEVPSTTTLPLATESSTNSTEIPLVLPLEVQSSFVMTPESSDVFSSVTLPPATARSIVITDDPLKDHLEVQSSFMMTAEQSVVPCPMTLPLATQSSTDSLAVSIALPLEVQSSFVMTPERSEVLSSVTLPLETQSSFVMTADSSEETFSFKNDRTGLVSLQTGVHNSSDMPCVDRPMPLPSNLSINQTSELVCVENVQSDVQETYYIEILQPSVSEASANTVGDGSFSDVFKRLPPTNAVRKRKSTTNFPQRVDVKQKRCEVPHTLWTYM